MSLDTDTELDDEVEFDGMDDEFEDEELDFDNVAPANGNYEMEMVRLVYNNGPNKKDPSIQTFGLQLSAKMVDKDGEWDGTFVNKYIWLGNGKISGQGRAQMKALADACGVSCEGRMRISEFAPVKKMVGKEERWVLTAFNEAHFGAYISTQERTREDGTVTHDLVPQGFMSIEELVTARELATKEEF